MPTWLIIVIALAVLLLVGAAIFWGMGSTSGKQTPRLELAIRRGSGRILRTTSVRGREDLFTVEMTNVGPVATTVEDIYLEVPDGWRLKMNASFEGRSLLQGDRPLPCRLDPGESVSYGVPGEPLRRQLIEMGVELADEPVTLQVIDVDRRIYETTLTTEQLSQ